MKQKQYFYFILFGKETIIILTKDWGFLSFFCFHKKTGSITKRGEAVSKFSFFLLFLLCGSFVALNFNNCGGLAPRHKRYTRASMNQKNEVSHPWPNETTTLKYSGVIASEVLFSDVDGNGVENAVFFSKSGNSGDSDDSGGTATGSQDYFTLRLVRSGNFQEINNIDNLTNEPAPDTPMLLIDVDMEGGEKELIYLSDMSVSDNRQKIVILDLVGRRSEVLTPRVRLPADSPLGFSVRNNGKNTLVEIGHNIIFISSGRNFSVESIFAPIDGDWGDFSDWMIWPNGLKCSKICGDGFRICSRICNEPVPRNGGAQCAATRVAVIGTGEEARCEESSSAESRWAEGVFRASCRERDCEETDCDDYEKYNEDTSNCDPDPANPRPGNGYYGPGAKCYSGSSSRVVCYPPNFDPDDRDPDDDDPNNGDGGSERCTPPKIYDSYNHGCFTPVVYGDIYLEYTRTETRGGDDQMSISITHRHRISLSHAKSFFRIRPQTEAQRNEYARMVAQYYCFLKDQKGVIDFETDTYSPSNTDERNVYVLCTLYNGLDMLKGSQCRIQVYEDPEEKKVVKTAFGHNGVTSFDNSTHLDAINHPDGETIRYLKSVRCRSDGG